MAFLESVLVGVYIGVLTGIFAAVVVYALTVVFTYVAGAKLPINYALLIGLGVAGLAGGPRLLLRNPEVLQSVTALVMLFVLLLITFYAHQRAQDLGNSLPAKAVAVGKLRRRTLASSVVRQVGRFGQVTVRPTGEIGDIEGYPSLPEATREAIRADSWPFPADLPITELESRLLDKLVRDYHLEDAVVSIDGEGRATISAAPSHGGFSQRIPDGTQAVTVSAQIPAGLAAGDTVRLAVDGRAIDGAVVGVEVAVDGEEAGPVAEEAADVDHDVDPEVAPPRSTAAGGAGRVAVAVDSDEVEAVIDGDLSRLYVRSRGRNKAFELVGLLRRHDLRFRKVTARAGADAGQSLAEAAPLDAAGVVVLARRRAGSWRFAPDRSEGLEAGDELYVAGSKPDLDALGGRLA